MHGSSVNDINLVAKDALVLYGWRLFYIILRQRILVNVLYVRFINRIVIATKVIHISI